MREKTILTFLFLLVGLGAGAVAALLFAPKPGNKTRKDLANVFEEGFNNGREALELRLKRLQKEFGELRQKVDDYIAEARST